MNGTRKFAQRYIATPAATAVLILTGVAAVNAVIPENMTATDGKIEIVDGKHTQELTRQMPFEPGQTISVKNGNGRLTVTGWDKDELLIVAHKRMERRVGGLGWVMNKLGIDFETSDDTITTYFENVEVEVRTTDAGLEIETLRPKKSPNVNVIIDYEIQVPREIDLLLRTSNGRINVSNIEGVVESKTSNGRVTYDGITGSAQARTSNGRVTLTNIEGSIHAITSNGSITLEKPTVLCAGDTISCITSNGSIRIELAKESTFDISAKTSSGRIRTDFDVDKSGQQNHKKRLNGRVGEGGGRLELSTSNGSITVSKI